jgi:hypothetical protein
MGLNHDALLGKPRMARARIAGDRPPQIVAGISGTLLLPPITAPLVGMDVAGERLAKRTPGGRGKPALD